MEALVHRMRGETDTCETYLDGFARRLAIHAKGYHGRHPAEQEYSNDMQDDCQTCHLGGGRKRSVNVHLNVYIRHS
jgi:hypothetical protein